MKTLLQYLVRLKNPGFTFDPSLSGAMLLELFIDKIIMWLRSAKLILRGRIMLNVFLGKNVRFNYLSRIRLGKFVQLHDYVCLSALGQELSIGNNVSIGAYSRLIVSTSFQQLGQFIRIGNNVGIGEFAYIGGAGGVEIGDETIVGQYLSCHPENHNYEDAESSIRFQGVSRKGIKVGANCWIGSKVTILDGVTIGEGSIIAAGAVVNKSFPPGSIIGGVPAKLLKTREGFQHMAA